MERIVEAFGKIFSIPADDTVLMSDNSMTVIETDRQSTFTQLSVDSPGDSFYAINNAFYRDLYNEECS